MRNKGQFAREPGRDRDNLLRVKDWTPAPADDVGPRERWLVRLLRLSAFAMLPAFLAMLLPTSWMSVTHRLVGIGSFPDGPLVEYLTRSIAALYGFHGVLLLLVSCDVRRYRPIVLYIGAMNTLFGSFMIVIDLVAGMPWYWTLAEGPGIAAIGLVVLWLARTGLRD